MAIHLITGVPGAGKSLRAVYQCVQRIGTELEQDRPVFGNVRGFRRQSPLPGSRYQHPDGRFEDIPGEWMDLPDGSIIMIDECQERWRRYRATGEPPPEIAALERHRHRNIDFILTCQNPKQLSDDVRSLVDTHEHLTKRGKGAASVYRWSGRCSTTPYSSKRDADCEVEIWRYPKWIYQEYVSASDHTVRNKIPRVFMVACAVFLAIPLSLWIAYKQVSGLQEVNYEYAQVSDTPGNHPVDSPLGSTPLPTSSYVADLHSYTEEVQVYGGAVMGDRCSLYDQSGRRVLTTWDDCMNAMARGLPQYVIPIDI